MEFMIYTYSYEYGWELYTKVTKEENILNIINDLSPYEYGQYIIVKQLKDRYEVYDIGFIAKPHTKKLKPRRKS